MNNTTFTCSECKYQTTLNLTNSQLEQKILKVKCDNCGREIEIDTNFMKNEIHKQAVEQLKNMFGKDNVV